MNLKNELDIIYQSVYKMNESLSPEDFDILISGFEDGINEGLGKWLGSMAGKVSNAWTGTKKFASQSIDKTKDLYRRGRKYATDAWEKLKTWVEETTLTIKGKIEDATKWVSTKFNTFIEKIASLYKDITSKIKEAWSSLSDKSSKFFEAIRSMFKNLMTSISKAIKGAVEKFIVMKDELVNWVKTNWTMLKKWVIDTKDGVLGGLSNIFNKAIEAIKGGSGATVKYAKIIATFIIIKPALMIANGVRKIPALYREYINRLKYFVKNEIEGFRIGFEEGSGRPWDRAKGFINQPTKTTIAATTPVTTPVANPAQAEVKTGTGVGELISGDNQSMKYIMTFENFKY